MASGFSAGFPWREEARLAGSLHDLGKYGDLFQRRLEGREEGLDHWSAGAWVALRDYKSTLAALCIHGHHVGLQRGGRDFFVNLDPAKLSKSHPLGLRLSGDPDELKNRFAADLGELALSPSPTRRSLAGPKAMLEARLLFSALVDADFLDTEAHFEGDRSGKKYRKPGPGLQAEKALEMVLAHIGSLASSTAASRNVREVRETLLREALVSAEWAPGLFTFTAPTGSGKTLAMLAFALAHAKRHGLRRIVMAVPYLSILEQTARTYRDVLGSLGDDYILEHHGLAGGPEASGDDPAQGDRQRMRRLLAQNWDAPLVLTTNVQLLESLFSNRPSACRKLHRLAGSIILFDEAQTLPLGLVVPTLAALSQFVPKTGASIVFATATQPAYTHLSAKVREAGGLGWEPREAVTSSKALFGKSRRVKPHWDGQEWDMDRLSKEVESADQVLCILNLKRHVSELMERLRGKEGLFHLSTNLCPAHRQVVLGEVRGRLRNGGPCRLVSTQCVEAGVDVDFPVVLRTLGPLEAVAQAAGRCNREGRRQEGVLKVFMLSGADGQAYPDQTYHQAAGVTRAIWVEKEGGPDLDLPETYEDYYRRLFNLSRPEERNPRLTEAIKAGDFRETALEYRLIREDTINILVPYEGGMAEYKKLLDLEKEQGINTEWMRRAQGLSVSCYRPKAGHPAWTVLNPARLKFKRVESDEWFLLNEGVSGWSYDGEAGLKLPQKDDYPTLVIA